jgi:hypothetical protein
MAGQKAHVFSVWKAKAKRLHVAVGINLTATTVEPTVQATHANPTADGTVLGGADTRNTTRGDETLFVSLKFGLY